MTLSFAPDSTPIASNSSSLFYSLDATLPRDMWQRQIAQAFQRWAVHTDVNIGFKNDGGQRIGSTGFTLGDPRFGDVRILSHTMSPEVLAISVPYDPARSGTLTGDVLLNDSYSFTGTYDLMSIMLHEAGHVFGLDHSTDPESPMFDRFNNTKTELTFSDVASIRSLYGDRVPDAFDQIASNNTFGNASVVQRPSSYTGSTPLAVFGDLTTNDDVDYYKFTKPTDDNGYVGPVTVYLQTSQISLMQPTIQVLDSNGIEKAAAVSSSYLGDVLAVTFLAEGDESDFYLRIDSPDDEEFAIGRYAAAIVFNSRNQVGSAAIENVLVGRNETADAETLRALFLNASTVFLNADNGEDNTFATAKAIGPTSPHTSRATIEEFASIQSLSDADFLKFTLPQTAVDTLTLTLWSVDARGLIPTMQVYSATGAPVDTRLIANGNRTVTLQIDSPASSGTYVVRVGSLGGVGNYSLSADMQTAAAVLEPFASASLGGTVHAREGRLFIAETQLMHLVLSVESEEGTLPLHFKIIDSLGQTRYTLAANPGETVSGASVLLTPGEYRVIYAVTVSSPRRIDAEPVNAPSTAARRNRGSSRPSLTQQPVAIPSYTFTLTGNALSGPIGPALNDPSLEPTYVSPVGDYIYPGGIAWPISYLWLLIAV
jgi:hypothetical protein